MLILTRRCGEAVVIGEDVTVTILGTKGKQIRIGVTAPKSLNVRREELPPRQQEQTAPGVSNAI